MGNTNVTDLLFIHVHVHIMLNWKYMRRFCYIHGLGNVSYEKLFVQKGFAIMWSNWKGKFLDAKISLCNFQYTAPLIHSYSWFLQYPANAIRWYGCITNCNSQFYGLRMVLKCHSKCILQNDGTIRIYISAVLLSTSKNICLYFVLPFYYKCLFNGFGIVFIICCQVELVS